MVKYIIIGTGLQKDFQDKCVFNRFGNLLMTKEEALGELTKLQTKYTLGHSWIHPVFESIDEKVKYCKENDIGLFSEGEIT